MVMPTRPWPKPPPKPQLPPVRVVKEGQSPKKSSSSEPDKLPEPPKIDEFEKAAMEELEEFLAKDPFDALPPLNDDFLPGCRC